MKIHTERRMIDRLIPAIGLIAGGFEEFGGKFLDHLLKTPLEHSGVNFLGEPVSSVLDSTSEDGLVVAQYSDETGYFGGEMQKASDDIDKALARRPSAKRILLIAAERKRPIVADNFKKEVLAQPRMKGRSIGILGAQTIAALIVRKLLFNDSAIEDLSKYLPDLAQMREEAARDRLFPDLPTQHRRRPAITSEIRSRLAASPYLTLTGLGGSGKSESATAYGVEHGADYDLRIWLEPDEFKGAKGLQALALVRGGTKRNVATLLKRQRCLLVIDDPAMPVAVEELVALCGEGSHVLVTARNAMPDEYRIPELAADEALDILNKAVASVCPETVFETIWETVGGHPLSYALMNAAVLNGGTWEDIKLDCQAVGELADPEQRLADRLLSRYREMLRKELSLFEWLGQPECDRGFLRYAVLPVGIRKLRERALTASDRPSTVRLHDVVYASLSSLDWWSADTRAHWKDVLERYLTDTSGRNDLSFWATALSLRSRLRTLVGSGDARPAYVLALLETTSPEGKDSLDLGDPVQQAAEAAAQDNAADALRFRMIIESFEWQYLRAKQAGRDEAKTFAERGLALFDHLQRIPGLTSRQRSEIRHHRGKTLAWVDRRDEALLEFEAVMASDAPLDASRLQLLRGYKNAKSNDKAIQLGLQVMNAAEAQPDAVSPSVLLAIMQDIPWREEEARQQILRPRQDFIVKTIVENAAAGVEQAFKTLAAVARFWSLESPEVLDSVLQTIARPDMERFEDDETRHGFADVLLEYGRGRGEAGAESLETALALFEGATRSKPFNEQRKAELLIEMSRCEEAEAILAKRDDLQTNGWIQRLMARALLGAGRPNDALNWIDRALADENCRSHFHEFWAHRYKIRQVLGEIDAPENLHRAISLAPAGPVKSRLETMLSELHPAT